MEAPGDAFSQKLISLFFLTKAKEFETCKRSDPNLNSCLIKAVNGALKLLKDGKHD